VLMRSVLTRIATTSGGDAQKTCELIESEWRELLDFVCQQDDAPCRQAMLLFAVQEHAHKNGFPSGLIHRVFQQLYEMHLVDKEAVGEWRNPKTQELRERFEGRLETLKQVQRGRNALEADRSQAQPFVDQLSHDEDADD